MSPRVFLSLGVIASLLLLAAPLHAHLTTNSPFQPLPSSLPAAPVPETPLKYGGFIQTREGMQFRVSDPARKLAAFLKLNQRDDALGVVVLRYDPVNSSITVDYNGRTLTLIEPVKPKLAALRPLDPRTATTPIPPTVAQTPLVAQAPSNDEQARLAAVTAEIAKRREAREQAVPGAGAPPPPAGVGAPAGGVMIPGVAR